MSDKKDFQDEQNESGSPNADKAAPPAAHPKKDPEGHNAQDDFKRD